MCGEFQLSILPLRFWVKVDIHACLIAFAQIKDTAEHVDDGRGFAVVDTHVSDLALCELL